MQADVAQPQGVQGAAGHPGRGVEGQSNVHLSWEPAVTVRSLFDLFLELSLLMPFALFMFASPFV